MSDDTASPEFSMTAKEKILLHLKEYWKYRDEVETPVDVTQKGISAVTGLALSHIPRTLKKMREDELVVESKRYVSGMTRRYKTYFLTDSGVKLSRSVLKKISARVVVVRGEERTIEDILADHKYKSPLSVIISVVEGDGGMPTSKSARCFLVGDIPFPEPFVDRAGELENLESLINEDKTKVIVVYGSQGYGTTALTAKFLENQLDKWSIVWIDLKKKPDHILEELGAKIGEAGFEETVRSPDDIITLFDSQRVIIVFDGYFHVPDKTVEFFSDLVEKMKASNRLKLIVTAREDTPSYNRFYTILDLHDSTVAELHVKGLDIDAFRMMLDDDSIDEDAVRRLFMFSRGKPTTLKLIANGDSQSLEKEGRFTPEEIKLMLYLKTLKKGEN